MKQNKIKIVGKMLLFLSIIAAVVTYVNHAYVQTNYYKNLNSCYKFQIVPDEIEVANLGASQAVYGMNYDVYDGYVSMNFALAAQTLEYDYAVLKTYIDKMADQSVIYIPIAVYSMYQQGDEIESIELRYYQFLSNENMPDWNLDDAIIYKYFPCLSAGSDIMYIFHDTEELSEINEKLENTYIEDDESRVCLGIKSAEIHQEYIGKQELSKQYDALIKIIELCKERNVTPILLVTPYTQEYIDALGEDFWTQFRSDLNDLSMEYDCPLYDYTTSEFCQHAEYFNDTTHMNENGSIAFSKDLLERTIMDGYLEEK